MKTIITENFRIYLPEGKSREGRFENDAAGFYGSLTFNRSTLAAYDGVYCLPQEIAQALKAQGFCVAVDGIDGLGGIPA